jgi:hypothetical protein
VSSGDSFVFKVIYVESAANVMTMFFNKAKLNSFTLDE